MGDPKVSTCVDCSTTIIGDILRCGACHQQHVAARYARYADTLPRLLARWFIAIEALIIATLVLIFAVRGCTS
jgi:hypothetical protein